MLAAGETENARFKLLLPDTCDSLTELTNNENASIFKFVPHLQKKKPQNPLSKVYGPDGTGPKIIRDIMPVGLYRNDDIKVPISNKKLKEIRRKWAMKYKREKELYKILDARAKQRGSFI